LPNICSKLKEISMKQGVAMLLVMLMVAGLSGRAAAQERSSTSSAVADSAPDASRSNGVPIERVIAAVAKKTGKKYLVDARVQGNVEILGQDISAVTYSDLLSILLVSGYTAVEGSNYISVVPESIVRALPLPLATGKDTFPDAQFVTAVVPVKNTMASGLVPILRPLMPTHGTSRRDALREFAGARGQFCECETAREGDCILGCRHAVRASFL